MMSKARPTELMTSDKIHHGFPWFEGQIEQFPVPIPFQEAIESLHEAVLASGDRSG